MDTDDNGCYRVRNRSSWDAKIGTILTAELELINTLNSLLNQLCLDVPECGVLFERVKAGLEAYKRRLLEAESIRAWNSPKLPLWGPIKCAKMGIDGLGIMVTGPGLHDRQEFKAADSKQAQAIVRASHQLRPKNIAYGL